MKTIFLTTAALCGSASCLAAEESPATAPSSPTSDMVVTAERQRSLTAQTATQSKLELERIPGGIEVVDAERYLLGRSSTMADTFALSPGVFAQPRFGSDEARISIRGSGLQRTFHGRGIRVMQDGVPLNLADGSFDMQAIEPLAASHIEILRGANALAQGAASLGGSIDYVSRTGLNSPGESFRVEAGSYGYLRTGIAGGFSEGSADLHASFTAQTQGGFRGHAEQENQRLFANFGWRFNEDLETRFYLGAINTESELPGNLLKKELILDPRSPAPFNVLQDQRRDFKLLRLANKTTYRSGDTTWELLAAWTHKDLNHPIFQVLDQNSHDFFLGLKGTHDSEIGGHPNLFQGGVNLSLGKTMAYNYLNVGGQRGPLAAKAIQTAANAEAFLENQFTIGHGLTLIAGGAVSYSLRDNDQLFGGVRDYTNEFTNAAPKIGFRWEADPGFQIYGNLSGSYETPSFSESITALMVNKAQTATTFEIGTRGSWRSLRWDVSAYHAAIDHELLAIDHDNNPATPDITINADKTLHRGVEMGLEADLLGTSWEAEANQRLVFRSAWTYGDFRFDGDRTFGDNQIAGLPQHLIRGELTWENASGWYAGPTFEWVPVKAFVDHANTLSAEPYAICGFKLGQRKETGLSWFIEARNLTDERYAATTGVIADAKGLDQRQFLPGDGRGLYGGLEWKW